MLLPAIDWKELWDKRAFKATVIGLSTVCGLSGVGVAGYHLWPEPAPKPPPPVETTTTQEAREFLASDDFKRQPLDKRIEWMDQARERMAQMDEEERRDLWRNMDEQTRRQIGENMRGMMMERMNRDVKTYHSLPASQREKFLDEQIDEMGQRWGRGGRGMGRSPRGNRPRGREGQARSGDRGRRPEGAQGRTGDQGRRRGGFRGRRTPGGPGGHLARMPADKRAQWLVYRKAMAKRMAERGMGRTGHPGR